MIGSDTKIGSCEQRRPRIWVFLWMIAVGTITAGDRAFIEQLDMCFMATVDAQGQPTCSYKGGAPAFVAVVAELTLAMPNYDGNGI